MNKLVIPSLVGLLLLHTPQTGYTERGLERINGRESRLALVVGNQAYTDNPLQNPVKDARDIKSALEKLDFTVIYLENADFAAMDEALHEFTSRLDKNSVGLFYFAGHGAQADGNNYLVPIGAAIANKSELKGRGYDTKIVLDSMEEAGTRVSLVIIDACRNAPFRGFNSSGLAEMGGGSGSIIAFAAAPGKTAKDKEGSDRNGTFTKRLLAHLSEPGLSVIEMLQKVQTQVADETQNEQQPWINFGPQHGQFCFAGCSTEMMEHTPSPTNSASLELPFWESVKDSSNPEDFKEYLKKYPLGEFVGLARNRIKWLTTTKAALPVPETIPAQVDSPYIFEPQAVENIRLGVIEFGEKLYRRERCETCHGGNLQGSSAFPNLLTSAKTADKGEFSKIVLEGKSAMPAFKANAKVAAGIDSLYDYINSKKPK